MNYLIYLFLMFAFGDAIASDKPSAKSSVSPNSKATEVQIELELQKIDLSKVRTTGYEVCECSVGDLVDSDGPFGLIEATAIQIDGNIEKLSLVGKAEDGFDADVKFSNVTVANKNYSLEINCTYHKEKEVTPCPEESEVCPKRFTLCDLELESKKTGKKRKYESLRGKCCT